MQPVPVSRITSGSCGKENFLNLLSHRSAPARFDGSTINFTDWGHLSRRARKERFVGAEQIVRSQRSGFRSKSEVARDLHHHLASDAEENGMTFVIGQQLPVTHDEKILTRAFGEMAVGIQQQRFI